MTNACYVSISSPSETTTLTSNTILRLDSLVLTSHSLPNPQAKWIGRSRRSGLIPQSRMRRL